LGLNEKICMILEENHIHSVKDLVLLDFDDLSKIENIGIKNLFKILNSLKNLKYEQIHLVNDEFSTKPSTGFVREDMLYV